MTKGDGPATERDRRETTPTFDDYLSALSAEGERYRPGKGTERGQKTDRETKPTGGNRAVEMRSEMERPDMARRARQKMARLIGLHGGKVQRGGKR